MSTVHKKTSLLHKIKEFKGLELKTDCYRRLKKLNLLKNHISLIPTGSGLDNIPDILIVSFQTMSVKI